VSHLKEATVSGRDHYDGIFQTQLQEEAEWLDRTSKHKADSIELLLSKHNIECETLVELGCGTGSVIRECQRRNLARSYVAVDYSRTAIDYLAQNSHGIETYVADVMDPSIGLPRSADVVVVSHVIEHLEEPLEFLRSIQRLNFKYLIAEVPLDDLLMGRLSALRTKDRTQNLAGHVQFFTASSFCRLLRSSGLAVLGSRRYMPILDPTTIQFVCKKNNSSSRTYCKMMLGRWLRVLTGPVWARFLSAHYAVIVKGPSA
jgi:SAM-dependent methyltransferase